MVIAVGMIVALPVAFAGYLWATLVASRYHVETGVGETFEELVAKFNKLPSVTAAFAPIIIPILLIGLKSFADFPSAPFGKGGLFKLIEFIGQPMVSLIVGLFLCSALVAKLNEEVLTNWIGEGLKDSASIIMITAAGGSLGAILAATKIGDYLGNSLAQFNLGIFLPFIIAAALKTAQGSSTVALITTATIVYPLLGTLGLASPMGSVLATMSIGCGAMVVSHANDSYFWVVSQFSNMKVEVAYPTQTMATLVQGVVGIITVWLLHFVLL